ncbi:hypothetical protein [Telmatospirillum sp. J64-1]|uniref:hypothetical protein n=1 Tax=Telmatospirillum sp. J64-1 TaxID=2502183 RepID=UPI00115F7028|nr:hypothetical protein [Telmatospirillum sp. J64-1]
MSFAGYASKAIALTEELSAGWSEEDHQALREAFHKMTLPEWDEWRATQQPAVAAFAAATPKQRRGLAARHPEPLLLKVAAIQFLAEAAALLRRADRLQQHLGASYRDMAGLAGLEYQRLQDEVPAYNPDEVLPPDWTHVWRVVLDCLARNS